MNLFEAPDSDFERWSTEQFPPYRFIPGKNPHPVRDPDGHSHGQEHEDAVYVDPEDWKQNSAYLYGVDLYNYAYWWESHEAWEDIWHLTDKQGLYGQFLQGLIQVSAAFIKWYLHQQPGLESLYKLGFGRLEFVSNSQPVYMGLDLDEHLGKIQNHFKGVLADESHWPDPFQNYPFIELQR